MSTSAAPHPTQSGRIVPVTHVFSVDVEEYFQVNAFEGLVTRDQWPVFPSRLDRSVDLLLDMLARHDATATFFTLGWIAERNASVVRRIASAGHEIASHGWWHRRIPELSAAQYREEVRSSKDLLEQITGLPVCGYRAPSFSILPGYEWALDVLIEEGYRYDSSLFPIRRPGYGYAMGLAVPHLIERPVGSIVELPPATTTWLGRRIPAAGGGYLRHFPMAIIQNAFREHQRRGESGMFYVHPWELDPHQPRLTSAPVTRLRHYAGLHRTQPRIEALLAEFRFSAARDHPLLREREPAHAVS
jgi:polysaccharide deacetylase family protein (PEP-CTERM system associated)